MTMAGNLNATATPGYGFSTNGIAPASNDREAYLYPHHDATVAHSLIVTAHALVTPPGVGIYATDEMPEGIEARLTAATGEDGAGKAYTEAEKRERRRRWRECLYESLPTGARNILCFSRVL